MAYYILYFERNDKVRYQRLEMKRRRIEINCNSVVNRSERSLSAFLIFVMKLASDMDEMVYFLRASFPFFLSFMRPLFALLPVLYTYMSLCEYGFILLLIHRVTSFLLFILFFLYFCSFRLCFLLFFVFLFGLYSFIRTHAHLLHSVPFIILIWATIQSSVCKIWPEVKHVYRPLIDITVRMHYVSRSLFNRSISANLSNIVHW